MMVPGRLAGVMDERLPLAPTAWGWGEAAGVMEVAGRRFGRARV